MHGHFYPHQQYMQRPAQGTTTARNTELTQSGLHYSAQQAAAAALSNGQVYQGHGGQHLQQQRRHQITHPSDYAQGHYALHPALFSQALQHQQQSTSTARQHPEHQRMLQQQFEVGGSNDPMRTLLTAGNPALQQLQMSSLNQYRLNQAALSSHHLGVNVPSDRLQHQPSKAGSRYAEESIRNISERLDPEAALSRSRSQIGLQNIRNTAQTQNLLSPEILMARHQSAGPSPPIYHHGSGTNYLHNLIRSPPANPNSMISPNQTIYSPARSHATSVSSNQAHLNQSVRPDQGAVSGQQYSNYPMMNRRTSQDVQSPRRVTPTGGNAGVTHTNVHVKRQTPSVNSSTAPVIIVDSDDDDEAFMAEQQQQHHPRQKSETRRKIKEDPGEESQTSFTRVVIDDDIEITGFKEAEIMSHMRPDCPIHKFERVDTVSGGPYQQNASKCSKCFCYVCDKPANNCNEWSTSNPPHCNAHSKASCWKARRNVKKSPLIAKLPNDEVTQEMTESGELSLQYMIRIRERYITYRNGIPCEYHQVPCDCNCHKTARSARTDPCMDCKAIHDAKKRFNYEPVREIALAIIQEIQAKFRDQPMTALIALEAVLSELCSQRPADFNHSQRRQSNPDPRCQCNFPSIIEDHIEKEIISLLTRFEVPGFFLTALKASVEEAIKPLQLEKIMKKFLGMKHWDDLLLRAVLSGSNTTGSKGREHLRETPEIIRCRIEKLDREKKYLSIIRYLKAVKIHQVGMKDDNILAEIDRWRMICSAHQGRFKEVTVQMMDIFPRKNFQEGNTHEQFPMDFILKLLDSLTIEDSSRNVRLDFFEMKPSNDHKITGRDADILVLAVLLILHQNHLDIRDKVSLTLWLAKWVNRSRLYTSLDPTNTRRWLEDGDQLIELANQSMAVGNAQNLLNRLCKRDPRVHLLIASMCIINLVSRYPGSIQEEHRREILDCYKNNEWALFLLVTQAQMMNYHDPNILRWITKFCETNSGVIGQIQENVIIEAIKYYPLDVLSEFLAALIKPEWTISIEPILRTTIHLLLEYSVRLFQEMPQIPKDVLRLKAKWVEERAIKPFLEQKLPVPHDMQHTFKNIIKNSCFLNPIKPNIELSRRILGDEWPRHCSKLTTLLMDKFKKFSITHNPEERSNSTESDGTTEEFSLLLWLLWVSNRTQDIVQYLMYFQENHSCDENQEKVASSKIPDEIANLLESTNDENFNRIKMHLLDSSRHLVVVETLSWLTCTSCATRMSTHWAKVWIFTAKSRLPSSLDSLIVATLTQFKEWLNKINFDVPECYDRLLRCLRTFLYNLVTTWQHCAIPLEEAKRLLLEVAGGVSDPNFRRDLAEMGNRIVEVELAKLRPKTTPAPEPVRQPQRPPQTAQGPVPQQPVPAHRSQHPVQAPRPPQPSPQSPKQVTVPQPVRQAPPAYPVTPARTAPPPKQAPPTKPLPSQQQAPPTKPLPSQQQAPSTKPLPSQQQAPSTKSLPSPKPTAPVRKPSREQNSAQKPDRQNAVELPQKQTPIPSSLASLKHNGPVKEPVVPKPPISRPPVFSKTPQNTETQSRNTKDEGEPFSPLNLSRTKPCPNCAVTISCASFRCPHCNKPTRTKQPVICPGCHQENLEVKKYSCEFCYRSLIDVMVFGSPTSDPKPAETKTLKETPQETDKVKKKVAEKRRKKSKTEEVKSTTTVVTTQDMPSTQPTSKIPPKNRPPLKNPPPRKSDSDSSSDDFVPEPPKKMPKIALKIKPNLPKPQKHPIISPVPPHNSFGGSLTDSDSDSSSDDSADSSSQDLTQQNKFPQQEPSPLLPNKVTPPTVKAPLSNERQKLSNVNQTHSTMKPNFHNKPHSIPRQDESSQTQKLSNKQPVQPPTQPGLKKRGVGHSSAMSKTQKKLLSRFRKNGKGTPKFSPSQKNHLASKLKESPKPPNQLKPSPLLEPPSSSLGNHLNHNERLHGDTGFHSNAIGSPSSLSFGLAKVRPQNTGHRTGGRPKHGEKDAPTKERSNETLLPKALNDNGAHGKHKKKGKKKDMSKRPKSNKMWRLERKIRSFTSKRKPGPASRSNYRKLTTMERKLRKLRRPHKLWKIPPHIKLPQFSDLSIYMIVSLSPFPNDKLKRIQSLISSRYKLKNLYA